MEICFALFEVCPTVLVVSSHPDETFDAPLPARKVVRSGVKPDVVVLSVGGSGLLSGVVEGLHRNGWIDVPVIAVETEGADSLAQSVR